MIRLFTIFLALWAALAGGVLAFGVSHDRASNGYDIEESSTHTGDFKLSGRTIQNRYDKTYRLVSETITVAGASSGTVTEYTYDDEGHGHALRFPASGTVTEYTYDDANNRRTKTKGDSTIAYEYGNGENGFNSNQLVSWTDGSETVSYTYDANGSRTKRREVLGGVVKEDVYTWNPWKRLAALVLQSGAAGKNGTYRYLYDHRSRRVSRDESGAGGQASVCSYSGGTSVLERTSDGVTVEYVRGPDMGGGVGGLLYSSRGGTRNWAHTNGRGDVVARTSETGALTFAAHYEAFGKRTQRLGSSADRQRANTKEEDPTGLLNEGHRYRDLETGMFISRDPAGFVDGPNVYTYVRQNPWTAFDPLGLWETGSYLGDVGKFYSGMGKAAGGLVKGVATSVVDLPQNLATIAVGAYHNATDGNVRAQAGATLAETGSAIKASAADYGNNLAAGKMETLGDATFQLLSIATPLAASKATTAANIAKAERVTALASELAAGSTAAKGGAVNVMIAKNGQIFSGVSKNVQGSGGVSSSVETLYGTGRKTCAEARTLSAMEASGVSSRGAVSASAAVNLPGRATGELMQACRQACAPVLKNTGVHDAVGAGGAINPQMLSVPTATPALPLLNKVSSFAEEDDN